MAAHEISGSMSRGNVATKHTLRTTNRLPENIDQSLTPDNIIIIDELHGKSVEEWINKEMQSALEEYDAKQPRFDRKLIPQYGDYLSWHKENNKHNGRYLDYVYEFNLQIGEHYETKYNPETKKNEPVFDENGDPIESLGVIYYKADETKKAKMREELFDPLYREAVDHFQEKYPHLKIVYAAEHYDEPNGTPHTQFGVVPIGEGFKNSLQKRVGIGHALANDGVGRKQERDEDFQMTRMYKEMHEFIKKQLIGGYSDKLTEFLGDYAIKEVVHDRKHERSDKYRSAAGEIEKQAQAAKANRDQVIAEKNIALDAIEKTIDTKQQKVNKLNTDIEQKKTRSEELDTNIQKKENRVDQLDADIENKGHELEQTKQDVEHERHELLHTRNLNQQENKALKAAKKDTEKEMKKAEDLLKLRQGLLEYVVDDETKARIDDLLEYLNGEAFSQSDLSYQNSEMAADKLQSYVENISKTKLTNR